MNERETSRQTSGNGDSAEEIEIIDVADLLEDPTDADESDLASSLDDPTEAYSKDSGSDAPMEVDDIFRILEDDEDDDDEIIDLLDEANGDENEAEGHLHSLDSTADGETEETAVKDLEIDTDLEDDFIAAFDLDEILGDAPQAISGVDMPQDPFESSDESDMDFIDALDIDLSEDGHTPPEGRQDEVAMVPQQPVSPLLATVESGTEAESKPAEALTDLHLTESQIDAALERVIRSMYAEKIDAILVEAIERTVNGEIDRLKNLLNQGSPDL